MFTKPSAHIHRPLVSDKPVPERKESTVNPTYIYTKPSARIQRPIINLTQAKKKGAL
jgi:hypothetical protein